MTGHAPLTDEHEHEHIWTAWQPIKESTAFEPGHSLRACEDCGDREIRGPDGGVLSVREPGARLVQFAADNPLPADRAPLTNEELAEIEARHSPEEDWRYASNSRPLVRRLVADLRASRAEVERLSEQNDGLYQACLIKQAEVERLRSGQE